MVTINERIQQLEEQIKTLQSKINDLSKTTDDKSITPMSLTGNTVPPSQTHPVDFKSGKGGMFGGAPLWNDKEGIIPPTNQSPTKPTMGFNKHTHSRYSGGALIKDAIEIVEYDWASTNPEITADERHSQAFWQKQPKISTVDSVNNEGNKIKVEKIGNLDLSFNPDTKTWGTSSYEIDVEKCYLVRRVTEQFNKELKSNGLSEQTIGAIATDSKGQEMKSPLLYAFGNFDTLAGRNENLHKTNVYWDNESRCWRFYAVFKPEIEE